MPICGIDKSLACISSFKYTYIPYEEQYTDTYLYSQHTQQQIYSALQN